MHFAHRATLPERAEQLHLKEGSQMVATTIFPFSGAGLPVNNTMAQPGQLKIKVDEQGEAAIKAAAGAQGLRTEYQGIPQYRVSGAALVTRKADGAIVGYTKAEFAAPKPVPGTGTPGLFATTYDEFVGPELKSGECAAIWFEMKAGQDTAYWSNYAQNINICAE